MATNDIRLYYQARRECTNPQDNAYQEVDRTRGWIVGDTVDVVDVDAAGNETAILADNLTILSIVPGIAFILSASVDTSAASGTPMIRNQSLQTGRAAWDRALDRDADTPGRFDRREPILDRELNAPIGGQTLYDVADSYMFKVGDTVDIIHDDGLLASTSVTAVGVNADAANNKSTIAVSGVHDTSALSNPFLKNTSIDAEKAIKRNQEAIDGIDQPVENEYITAGNGLDTVFETVNLFVENSSKPWIDHGRLIKGTAGTRATHVEGAGNSQLTFTAMLLGVLGNEIEVEVVSAAGFGITVTKSYGASSTQIIPGQTQYLIQINNNSDAATSQELADALNAHAEVRRIVQVQYGGDGTGAVSAFGPTNLAGGLNNGTRDYAELEQVFENSITGTGFKFVSLHLRPNEQNRYSEPPADTEEMTIDYRRAKDNVDR